MLINSSCAFFLSNHASGINFIFSSVFLTFLPLFRGRRRPFLCLSLLRNINYSPRKTFQPTGIFPPSVPPLQTEARRHPASQACCLGRPYKPLSSKWPGSVWSGGEVDGGRGRGSIILTAQGPVWGGGFIFWATYWEGGRSVVSKT